MSLPTMTIATPAPTSSTPAASNTRGTGASERAADFDAKVAQELGEQTQQHTSQEGTTEAGDSSSNSIDTTAPQVTADQSQIAFELIVSQETTETAAAHAPIIDGAVPDSAPVDEDTQPDLPAELSEEVVVPQAGSHNVPVELPEDGAETAAPTPRAQDNTARDNASPQQQPANPQPGTPAAAPQPAQENAGPRITATQQAQAAPEPTTPVATANAPAGEPTPTQPAAAQSTPQPAPTVPVVATAPVVANTTSVSEPAPVAAPPATTPAGMLEQVRGPIGRLAQASAGEHTFTVNVTPENLGPVTVRAHIGVEGIRVELIGATDAARDSLRAILNDLKRDLQSTGMNAQLDVGSERSDTRDHFGAGEFGRGTTGRPTPSAEAGSAQFVGNDVTTPHNNRHPDAHGVDIMA